MALNNFTNLKAAVVNQSHRNDVANKIDDFVLVAEQEMYNNPIETLNVRELETRATADTGTSDRFLALPTGFLRARRILIDDKTTGADQYELRYYAPEVLPLSSQAGMPRAFTVTSQIEFDRIADAVYNVEVQYFAIPTALSTANQTNDVLTNTPSIYLYGTLWALNQWAERFDVAEYYYDKFIGAIKGANLADDNGRYGPAPFMRIEGCVV